MENNYKICIVGFGSIGKKHYLLVRKLYPSYEIIIVSKKTYLKLPKFIKIKKTIDEALKENINAAIICSPASAHTKQAISIAKKGINLFVEKPLSNNLSNLDSLKDLIIPHF